MDKTIYQAILFIRSLHIAIVTLGEMSRLYHWEWESATVQ